MADRNQSTTYLIIAAVVIVLLILWTRNRPNVFCTTAVVAAGKPVQSDGMGNDMGLSPDTESEPEMRALDAMGNTGADPYFATERMMPKVSVPGQPDWVKQFEKGDNMLLQQNFLDTTDTEKFQLTRSVCGKRFQSRDIRRTPTVTFDPRSVNSFSLPVINPECALEFNEMKGSLDC